MRRIALIVLVALAEISWAEPFTALGEDEIEAALNDVTLTYEGGEVQTFYASGRTLYDNGRPSWGYWAARGDRYCSQWPPADGWACYRMDRAGDTLRFIGERGDISAGKITR
ncbi:MAG: hypothetical protein AAF841_07645 [Pseudomonadota bacterium]